MPRTRLGRAAVGLLVVAVASLALFAALVASGQRGGETFLGNPWLAVSSLSAAVAAIASGAVAVVAIASSRERAALVALAALVGLLVALWVGLEIAFPH